MAQDRPNIIVFMTDDHAQWALGCYGNPDVQTPTLDYLAEDGIKMTNAYTPSPVCSPARASFMTGLYPSQHGVHDYLDLKIPEVAERNWIADEITLPQLLQSAGYHTGLIGKWHCGQDDQHQPGFDSWFGIGLDEAPPHSGSHTFSNQGHPDKRTGYKTDILTDKALQFLRNQQDSQQPYFLFVGYIGTHSPWQGHPPHFVRPYQRANLTLNQQPMYPYGRMAGESTLPTRHNPHEALAQYYAAITHIDQSIGRILSELETLGSREQTLIVYTADHGLNCGQHGIWGKGNGTRPLNMLEASVRVPLIISGGGGLFKGQERTELVDHCDLFETLLDVAGVPPPQGKARPGSSYRAMLTAGAGIPGWKTQQIGEYGTVRMIRGQQYKLVYRHAADEPHELYDLLHDPTEQHNLFEDESTLAETLKTQLGDFFAQYSDSIKNGLNVAQLPRHNPYEAWRNSQ